MLENHAAYGRPHLFSLCRMAWVDNLKRVGGCARSTYRNVHVACRHPPRRSYFEGGCFFFFCFGLAFDVVANKVSKLGRYNA